MIALKFNGDVPTFTATRNLVDLRKLEFMSSSCFKSVVSWIDTVQEKPADAQSRIRLRSNPQVLWQRRSMDALECFAVDLIDIEN